MRDASAIYDEVMEAAMAVMERHGIGRDDVRLHALVSYAQVQRSVIRAEYKDRRKRNELDSLRAEIAGELGVSSGTVQAALYR